MRKYFPSIKKIVIFSLLCFFYLNNQSFGQSQSYLDGLPSKNDIISKIKGDSPKETYGKQIAALEIMCDIIIFHKLDEKPKVDRSAKESALLKEYYWADLINEYSKNVESLESPEKRREFQIYSHNLISDELEAELVNNLFSIEAKNQYEKASKLRTEERIIKHENRVAEKEEKIELEKQRSSNKTNAIISFIAAILFLAGWVRLRLWIGKRQFNRRNEHGVEEFKTHGDLVNKRLTEESVGWIAFFVLVIGLGLIVYGVYLISLLN